MISTAPLSTSPIAAGGSSIAPPLDLPEITDGVLLADDPSAFFLNVLADGANAATPGVEFFIANLLGAEAAATASGRANRRQQVLLLDSAILTLSSISQVLPVLIERIAIAADPSAKGRFRPAAAAGVRFQDSVAAAWAMLLADQPAAADDAAGVVRRLSALADTLQALGSVQGRLTARAAVAVAAALEARASGGWGAEAVDQVALSMEARSLLAAMLEASDAAAVGDTPGSSLRIVVLTGDSATLDADPAAALRAFSSLGDGAALYCSLRIGGTDYHGWALNTELRAVTEYRNVPFDSYAILNGRTYAAGDAGIFELAGDTDAGQPIEAWFRPFLTNFGTQKMKRVTDLWIGSSAVGLFVKVHTKDPATGKMVEDIYPVEHAHGAGSDKGRVKIGRGLSSNYWTLTVGNVAGADFDVQSIEWKPLVLDRRQ
ncbi:hypothetical protein LJB71_08410 [Thermomonas sp. S9]|uniref:hypothetical protein n=1 Tax=Thermomonas sp. S9 TaxID=2885203 RepID=UPI00216B1175|nr:hypothetical protein [Thermomonas sp. S9]MCR6496237.1 hypothetical protein [Thermomonas sp. S9]